MYVAVGMLGASREFGSLDQKLMQDENHNLFHLYNLLGSDGVGVLGNVKGKSNTCLHSFIELCAVHVCTDS